MKTEFSLWSISHKEKPVFITGIPAIRTGFPVMNTGFSLWEKLHRKVFRHEIPNYNEKILLITYFYFITLLPLIVESAISTTSHQLELILKVDWNLSLEIKIFEISLSQIFILKFTEPLQSYCCSVHKNLPRKAELARQVSRYLWRGSVDFKMKNLDHFSSSFLS